MSGSPLLVGVFLLLSALAGCIGIGAPSADDGSLPPGSNVEPERGVAREIRLVNCRSDSYSVLAKTSEIQERLPRGYTVSGYVSRDLTNVHLDLRSCEAAILDNQTVIRPTSFAMTRVMVDVNKTLQMGVDFHSYAFEVFLSDARLVEVYLHAGFPAIQAEIDLLGSPPKAGFKLGTGDDVWYQGDVIGGSLPGWEWDQHHVIHTEAEGLPPSWAESQGKLSSSGDEAHVILHVYKGLLASIGTGPQGVHYSDSGPGTFSGTIRFGQQ